MPARQCPRPSHWAKQTQWQELPVPASSVHQEHPKTHAPHAHQNLIVFSFVQVCASTVDVKHATEANSERARETRLRGNACVEKTSYHLQITLHSQVHAAHVCTPCESVRHQTRFGKLAVGHLIFFAYTTPLRSVRRKSSGVGRSRHAFLFRRFWAAPGTFRKSHA